MQFQFNTTLERANCHIRATRVCILPEERVKEFPHKHFFVEFHCVFSGQEIITLPHEKREIVLTAGDILLLPQGVYHGVHTKGTSVERFCFNFSAEPVGKEPSSIVDLFVNIREPVLFDGEEAAMLIMQCQQMCKQEQGYLLELRQGMLFLNMALNLMSKVPGLALNTDAGNPLELRQKWIIEDYIAQHFTDNTGIEGLAQALFLSQRQTSSLVKRFFGEGYKTIIIRRRMELAEIYLQDPNKRLDEIAYDVGYRSYSGFELCFKRFFDTTPQKMRDKALDRRK